MPGSPRVSSSFLDTLRARNLAGIRAHLTADIDINAPLTSESITALAFASSIGFDDGVQILLAAGAKR